MVSERVYVSILGPRSGPTTSPRVGPTGTLKPSDTSVIGYVEPRLWGTRGGVDSRYLSKGPKL